MLGGGLARFALEAVAQDVRRVTGGPRGGHGGIERVGGARDQPGLGARQTGVARFGRLVIGRLEKAAQRRLDGVSVEHREGVGEA